YPNCWTVSAAGHVDAGMTYDEAAAVEFEEETGLDASKLVQQEKYYFETIYPDEQVAKRFVQFYTAEFDTTPVKFTTEEVSDFKWFTRQELDRLVAHEPDKVSDVLSFFYDVLTGKIAPVSAKKSPI